MRLSWGILGCARISRRGLIPGIQGSETGSLRALASRDPEKARAWAREFHIARSHGDYHSLLEDPEIDAVYIPLPNELHKPWVIAAADVGKHVLCEKPLALDAEDAREMVEHCRARGVLLMEAFMWRHQPRTLELRALVSAGCIGVLRLVRSSFSFPIDPGDWRLDPSRGGGSLWDVGCYGVNTARYFAGSEPEIARGLGRFGPTGVDLAMTAILEFPSGIHASIDCSFETPFRCVYELVGTKGVVEVPDAYLPLTKTRPAARLRALGTGSDSDSRSDSIIDLQFDAADQYSAMVDNFARSVWAGRLLEPGEDGLAQMKVMDVILASARS
jgi:predicted dehydrogenase